MSRRGASLVLLFALAALLSGAALAADESSSAAPASEESRASNGVMTVPNADGASVTFVSAKNDFQHVEAARKEVNHFAVEEAERKRADENGEKTAKERRAKKAGEHAVKDKLVKEQADKGKGEQKLKSRLKEEADKRIAGERGKARAAMRRTSRRARRKLAAVREAAAKKHSEDKIREARIKRKKRAAEAREKRARARAEQRYKATNIRFVRWKNAAGPYLRGKAVKLGRLCLLEGLMTGGGGLVGSLPSYCRPSQGRLVFTASRSLGSRLDVLADGRIYSFPPKGASRWLSLNQVSFDTRRVRGVRLGGRWQPFGHGYRAPAQTRAWGELCAVSGMVRGGAWEVVAHAGNDCRPSGRLIFSGNNHMHVTRLDLHSNGWLAYAGGYHDHSWVSLDGVIFARGRGGSAMRLARGWSNFGRGFRGATFMRRGRLCVLGGLVRHGGDWPTHVATLPRGCRPQRRLVFGTNVHNHNARVDVLPDGRVVFVAHKSRHNWMSLSQIHFVAHR